jgi:hypothetical protein
MRILPDGTLGIIIWWLVDWRFLFGLSRLRPATGKIRSHWSDGFVPWLVVIDIYGIPAIARVAFSRFVLHVVLRVCQESFFIREGPIHSGRI